MSDLVTRRSVLVVGSANMDMVVSTPRFPRPGETVLGGDFGMYPGGKGANQAVACARLGGDVTMLAKMGRDIFSERLARSLADDDIDTNHLLTDEDTPTGIALITVDQTGQNEIIVVSGSNMKLTPAEVESRGHLFDRAGIVMLQLEIPLEAVAAAAVQAKNRGAAVILNPAPATDLPDSLLQSVDFITPNESETELLTGRMVNDHTSAVAAARMIIERGVRHVILTLGERGVLHVTATGAYSYPAYQVDVVDTTAAGDAFNGALAFALSQGDDVQVAVPFANAVAGYCVTRMGAQISMPTLGEVEEFIASHPEPVFEERE